MATNPESLTDYERRQAQWNAALEKAREANKARHVFGVWKCARCGTEKPATAHQKRQKYCSKECLADVFKTQLKGENNPNWRNLPEYSCFACGKSFFSYHERKYCSLHCAQKTMPRTAARKDDNHADIVKELEDGGVKVIDMSKMGNGFPDILVWFRDQWDLIEIKNPKTYYGKKGLNKIQKDWAESWQGGPVYVVKTSEDCQNFIAGRLELVEQVGGYKPPIK